VLDPNSVGQLDPVGGGESAPADVPPTSEAVKLELVRILASETFRSASGQREFLRYTVEETLAGRGSAIKEFCVATDVFKRGSTFDSKKDTIVRVEARKLRLRLAKYYESEGKDDSVLIEFPKGTYAPLFKHTTGISQTHAEPLDETDPEECLVEGDTRADSVAASEEKISAEVRSSDGNSLSEAPSTAVNGFRRMGKQAWTIGVLVALIIIGAIVFLRRTNGPVSQLRGQASVLVLPFNNLNSNADDEFFSNGLTDELIDALGRIPDLRVVARASAFQFKGKPLNLQDVGRQLRVRTVLEGSVRRAGDRVRITAELDDTTTGYRVWSNTYERELKDVLVVQREIAQAIVNALGVQISGGTAQRVFAEARPVSPDAYESYLQGLFYWNKGTPDAINSAIGYFERAIAKEPDFGPAYVGLAHSYSSMVLQTSMPSSELVPKIQGAATRALELDPTLGGAHLDLAAPYSYAFDWNMAEKEFKKALELNPGDPVAHVFYSGFLMRVGRLEEALQNARRAAELDPVSPLAAQASAQPLYQMRRFQEAVEQYQAALKLDQNYARAHQGLGITYSAMGRTLEAVREAESASKLAEESATITGQLAYSYARSGNTDKARKILDLLLERSKRESVRAFPIAQIYLGLEDRDSAFKWLSRAVDQREASLFLKTDPIYDTLRTDPRFGELLRRMNLQQ
jgi:TolB-like protein/Tfp pilus assembly protein PilF